MLHPSSYTVLNFFFLSFKYDTLYMKGCKNIFIQFYNTCSISMTKFCNVFPIIIKHNMLIKKTNLCYTRKEKLLFLKHFLAL